MRLRPLGLLLAGAIVASTACSTDTTVATAPSPPGPSRSDLQTIGLDSSVRVDAVHGAPSGEPGGSTYTVTIDPLVDNELHFGRHTLRIPARAICDPSSGYGIGTWDDGCKLERDSVAITALVRVRQHGIPRIDFSPELRFSPKQIVVLTLRVPSLTPALSVGNILYCASQATDVCADEAATDPDVRTYPNYLDSSLFRRIKHFSGYFVQE